jgi:hypothetical protein
MADYENYNLLNLRNSPAGVYDLSGGLLRDMAESTGYELTPQPDTQNLSDFIGYIGPRRTLQDNIELARERMSATDDADDVSIAADWVERSGSLNALERNFTTEGKDFPIEGFGVALFNTAVGRWQERRANKIIELKGRGVKIGHVVILAGTREMGEGEHPQVAEIAAQDGVLPTEHRFASTYIADLLKNSGLPTYVTKVDNKDGDTVIREGMAQHLWVRDWNILAVGNAPSALQVAGQFRKAARSLGFGGGFDDFGSQLFVAGDSIEVARHGEAASTHQNPFTALGQIARNALMLHEQSHDLHSLRDPEFSAR